VSVLDANPQFNFTPFHAIVEDGLDRMLDVLDSEEFAFDVKGSIVKSNVAEAVLISPKIYDAIRNDRSTWSFAICDGGIEVAIVAEVSFICSLSKFTNIFV
jgi:hypothetical protein